MVMLDSDGRYLDADAAALDLLGVGSVEELRSTPPETFAALPPDPEEQEAWREAYFATRADGVMAEAPFRRLDGELVRVRLAILDEGDGRYRALFYPIERPTTNLSAKVYRIAEVLAEWRSAERRLVDLDPESEEAHRVTEQIELLREQHHLLFGEARRRGSAS
jgi:PAS domain-containing protein